MKVGLDNAKTLAGILFIQSSATVDALEQSLKKVYSIKIGVFFGQEKRREEYLILLSLPTMQLY